MLVAPKVIGAERVKHAASKVARTIADKIA